VREFLKGGNLGVRPHPGANEINFTSSDTYLSDEPLIRMSSPRKRSSSRFCAAGILPAACSAGVPPATCSAVIPPATCSAGVPPATCSAGVPPAACSTVIPPATCSAVIPPATCSAVIPPAAHPEEIEGGNHLPDCTVDEKIHSLGPSRPRAYALGYAHTAPLALKRQYRVSINHSLRKLNRT